MRPPSPSDVLIAGTGMVPFRRYADGSTPRDWVRAAAGEAITGAGIEPDAIDAVVVGCESDHFSLQLAPGALVVDEIGLVPRPVMRVESGGGSGANALRAGILHILSGLYRCVLVVGFEHAASHLAGDDARALYALSFDADVDGMAGASAAALYALSFQDHMARFGSTMEQCAAVSVKNHGNALKNPLAHKPLALSIADVLASRPISTPYRLLDCSVISDGAAAVVLARADFASATGVPRVRIAGSGCAADHVRLGDRAEPGRFASKAAASRAAYAMAGIDDPSLAVDVAEVYDSFTGAELQGIEALGLCADGAAGPAMLGGAFGRDGRLPVNLSGGLLGQGGPPGAVGIAQAVAVTRLLRGTYWEGLQPARELRVGVIDSHGGIATVSIVHVLERLS